MDFAYPFRGWELHQNVVGGDDRLEGVEAWSIMYDVISRWDLDHKESKSLGHLAGSFPNSYKESDCSIHLHGVSDKPNQCRIDGLKPMRRCFILWKAT